MGAAAAGGVEALLRPETARAFEAANDDKGALGQRRLEVRLGYGIAHFEGRYTGTPSIGLGLSEAEREVILGWRLAESRRAGLVFGLDVEAARREGASGEAGPEHRIGLGLGWQLVGARREDVALDVRFEGSLRDAANDNREPDQRIGLKMTARF